MQPAGHLAAPLGGIGQVRNTGQQSGRAGLAVRPDQAGDGDSQAFHAGVKDEPAGPGALVPVPGLVSQQAREHISSRVHATGPAACAGLIQHSQQRRRVHDQHDRVRILQHQPGLRARDPEPVRERGHRVIEQLLLPACQRPQGDQLRCLPAPGSAGSQPRLGAAATTPRHFGPAARSADPGNPLPLPPPRAARPGLAWSRHSRLLAPRAHRYPAPRRPPSPPARVPPTSSATHAQQGPRQAAGPGGSSPRPPPRPPAAL